MVVGISAPCDACQPASEDSAAILSFLPDGSDLQIYASGIRAPVGLTFFPGTSQLLVSMNQRDDLGDETPGDWLAVVSQGQDWGFPDCYGQASTDCAPSRHGSQRSMSMQPSAASRSSTGSLAA
jgi:glucose/arabinose dehydrogenase